MSDKETQAEDDYTESLVLLWSVNETLARLEKELRAARAEKSVASKLVDSCEESLILTESGKKVVRRRYEMFSKWGKKS